MTTSVLAEIESLRRRLLDLTLNNRLLNYRPLKRRSIEIVDERPAEIVDFLVLNERLMFFKAAPETSDTADDEVTDGEPSQIWRMPEPDTTKPGKHTDRYLQTELTTDLLQRTLFETHKAALSVLQEQGYTVLFLAVGFLEWYDENTPEKPRRAPLILVPIDLNRASVGSPFRISWTGEDLMGNISLQARLRDADISIPDFTMPDTKGGINDYLQCVSDSILKKDNWLVKNDCVLGLFSFSKFVMYNDLNPEILPADVNYEDNPIFHTVFQGSPPPDQHDTPPKYPRKDVVDADPSQIDVIDAAAEGLHLLVEGPPGTGKSQTILNVIARLLGEGKRVLFVSEKMAALEVVKQRLDHIGLGDFCLEVHSRYSSRKGVLKQLDSTLNLDPPPVPDADKHTTELDALTTALDNYVTDLHKPFGLIGRSPYQLVGEIESAIRHFEASDKRLPPLQINDPDEVTAEALDNAEILVGELATVFDTVKPLKSNPWYGCNPRQLFEDERLVLGDRLTAYRNALETLTRHAAEAMQFLKSSPELTLNRVRCFQHALDIIPLHDLVAIDQLTETRWNAENSKASGLISQLTSFQRQREKVLTVFLESGIERNAAQLITETDVYSGSLLRFFQPAFYRFRKTIKSVFRQVPGDYNRIKADLGLLQAFQEVRASLTELAKNYAYLFGTYWNGEDSDPETLKTFMGWIIEIRQLVCSGCLSDDSLQLIASGINDSETQPILSTLTESVDELNRIFSTIESDLSPNDDALYGKSAGECALSELDRTAKRWLDNLDTLPRWSSYCQVSERCRLSAAAPLLAYLDQDDCQSTDLLPAFRGRFYGLLLKQAIRIRQPLDEFNAEIHEAKIKRFQFADKRANDLNRFQLAVDLYTRLPTLTGASPGSQAGVLNAQLNRKRGHMPIRQLLRHCGSLIQQIKPCFMMSPLSIAQFLQPGEIMFDVVIFDEASQVRPEEAVGAFLRARQLIVMGDSKQLPPTSFFDRLASGDDEEVDSVSADMESLLTLCRGRLPEKPLEWHYRSRHHSLITVSNRESYDDRLMVFPSPFDSHPYLGLFLKHLPKNRYDRGKTRMNRGEARDVVDAVFEHFQNYPEKTLGVATFSASQRVAIEQEMELRLQESPELEKHLVSDEAEPFFVKNLETVQGDERDVIFISIGYGFDADNKLTLNFGPLNQEGGERRLNVLITRARERCLVFSNFKAGDLHHCSDTSPRGVRYLKTFLSYADQRNVFDDQGAEAITPNSLERFIADDLNELGNSVVPHVGCQRFHLDMAVADPEQPGHYIAGIECDGHQYAKSRLARERDRLRPEILTRMGWNLQRVWSIDWFKARKTTAKRLQNSLVYSPKETGNNNESDIVFHDPLPSRALPGSDRVADYSPCSNLGIDTSADLASCPPRVLATAVKQVVDQEGPVHQDDVVRRIRELWGHRHTGSRIRDALEAAVTHATENQSIDQRDAFLWPAGDHPLQLRRRTDIDWNLIPPEEIALAVKVVLMRQFATPEDELVREVAYLFGMRRVGEESTAVISQTIQRMLADGILKPGYADRLEAVSDDNNPHSTNATGDQQKK